MPCLSILPPFKSILFKSTLIPGNGNYRLDANPFLLLLPLSTNSIRIRSLTLSLSLSLSFSCPSLKLNSKQISFKYIQFKSNFTKITFPVSEKIFFLADPTKKPELLSAIESQKHWLSSSSASAIPVVDDENLKKERENARKLFNGNTTGMIQHNNNTTPHHPLKIAFKPSLGPGRGVDLRQPHAPRGSCRGWLCCWFPV